MFFNQLSLSSCFPCLKDWTALELEWNNIQYELANSQISTLTKIRTQKTTEVAMNPKLGKWLQQIPGRTYETSIQKRCAEPSSSQASAEWMIGQKRVRREFSNKIYVQTFPVANMFDYTGRFVSIQHQCIGRHDDESELFPCHKQTVEVKLYISVPLKEDFYFSYIIILFP